MAVSGAVVLRRAARRVKFVRGFAYKGGKQPPKSSSSSKSPTPTPATSKAPNTSAVPSAAAGASVAAAAATAASSSATATAASASSSVGGSLGSVLLGSGVVAAGVGAYYYYSTSMIPQPSAPTTISLDEEPSFPVAEAQPPSSDALAAAAEEEDGEEEADPPPAQPESSAASLLTEEEGRGGMEEEQQPHTDTAQAQDGQEEEPIPEMQIAGEEESKQAEIVTGLLNDVLTGGGVFSSAEEAGNSQPHECDGSNCTLRGSDTAQVDDLDEEVEGDTAILGQVIKVLEAQLATEKARTIEAQGKLEAAQAAAHEEIKRLQEEKLHELKVQQENLAMTAAKALTVERTERLKVLEDVRQSVNLMSEALKQKQEENEKGRGTHKLALATFALQEALEGGRPIGTVLSELKAAAPGDALVETAVGSLSKAAGKAPEGCIPTRTQLLQRFDKVVSAAGSLVLMPEGSSGLMATVLSSLAAYLRMPEVEAERVGLQGGGLPAATARARAKLAAGHLQAAAQELECATRHSAAAAVVADWAAGARARAVADQAILLIQAHSMTVAASLAA